jgi:hypothetical protein
MLAATSVAYLIAGGIIILNIATLYMSDWERVHPNP